MEILLLLVPLSVVLAFLIGAAFWWSVRSGQFDDLEGPAWRVVGDDDRAGLMRINPSVGETRHDCDPCADVPGAHPIPLP